MVPLRRNGFLKRPSGARGTREALAAGVGSDSVPLAAWPINGGVTVAASAGGPVIEVPTSLRPHFVQALPGGRILLASARTRGADNAEVWTAEGKLERTGFLGDAIEHLLTTPSGDIWVAYFDEAMGQDGPAGSGLARFAADLQPAWAYPAGDGLPWIADCYSLNVTGESAWCCPYTSFHLISVQGDRAVDHGPAPSRGASQLLVSGRHAALIGGYGPNYDLITPLRLTADGVEATGAQQRLVLPDGLELPPSWYTCRGSDLHVITRYGAWYRLSLDDLVDI